MKKILKQLLQFWEATIPAFPSANTTILNFWLDNYSTMCISLRWWSENWTPLSKMKNFANKSNHLTKMNITSVSWTELSSGSKSYPSQFPAIQFPLFSLTNFCIFLYVSSLNPLIVYAAVKSSISISWVRLLYCLPTPYLTY